MKMMRAITDHTMSVMQFWEIISRSGGCFSSGFSLSLHIGNGFSWALDFVEFEADTRTDLLSARSLLPVQ